jgi:hypothetical protein
MLPSFLILSGQVIPVKQQKKELQAFGFTAQRVFCSNFEL